ncbi:ABC transporter ATP-binding protein [Paenibacillus radicis (ex Gao et al. 2016)]|uniref:Multidrug ABC transporter permease n=1 Tax=Paenibacillus radicis (ex Gao et al. 2016) TaxID=1737354 RepID=A0A917GSD2_9BACL|nr:ABC transporter ATP-binding protein [Paenibacillus radicis (ex Gao et al. 2016)]GGG55675.1 multidrug ABC transporter permease [Paenibacillus radicis (ex Gao et al. 2016)]
MKSEMKADKKGKMGSWKPFLRMIWETKPSKWMLGVALGLSIVSTLVGLVVPLFTKNVVDSFTLTSISSGQIVILAVAFLGQAAAAGVSIYLLSRIGQTVVAKLRDRLWKKLLALAIPYYDKHRTGDTISRVTNDTAIVKGLITEHMTGFFNGIISIIGAIVIMVLLDWKMTLIMLLAVPLVLAVMLPIGRMIMKLSKSLQDETATFTSNLNQALSEIRLVKASNAEPLEYERGKGSIMKLLQMGIREGKLMAFISPLIGLVMMGMLVLIIGYGGMRVSSGELTAGDLVAFILYLIQIVMPINQISSFVTQMNKAVGATERIIETLDSAEEPTHSGDPLVNARQPIAIEKVSFAYGDNDAVLKDINFTLQPGKVTAIVGPSGGGKTTMFSLLERFYEPQSGSIKIGGKSIYDLSLDSWRSHIGYVSQESPLIAGTIRDNLTYGANREISDAEITYAARMAYADIFIEELPDKYETEVGERGIKLSGGQRQRIAIARALLRDPSILMLDEATSSLDSKSEVVVQQALDNLMDGRTTLVIAHRLSTVVDADQILFVEKGTITGRGTHEDLLRSHELYREFANQQLRILEQV